MFKRIQFCEKMCKLIKSLKTHVNTHLILKTFDVFSLSIAEVNSKRLRKRCCENTWCSTLFTYQ